MGKKPFCYVTHAGKTVNYNILEKFACKGQDTKQILTDGFTASYGVNNIVEPIYTPLSLAYLLELNVYHMRCVKTKARDTAGIGWDIKPAVDNPSRSSLLLKEKIIEAFDSMSESLAATLNKACVDWESIGYGVLEVIRINHEVDGDFAKIVHIPAVNVRIHYLRNKFQQLVGNKQRWFKTLGYQMDIHCDTGVEYPLGTLTPEERATEILFWINYSPRSLYYGIPDVIPSIGAIQGDISRRDYNISFFDNYGIPSYAVFITGDFDPGDPVNSAGEPDPLGKTPLEWEIEAHFSEMAQNPHSVLILSLPSMGADSNVKVEFVPLAKESKDASFRLYRVDNRDEVLAAHGVPPYRLGIVETGTLGGNVAEEANKVYKNSVIEPRQSLIEDLINRHIIWGIFEAYDWEFKLAPLDDSEEMADMLIAEKIFAMAGMTPNDLIRNFGVKFGLSEVDHPAMNAHYLGNKPLDLEDDSLVTEVQGVLNEIKASLSGVMTDEQQTNTGEPEDIEPGPLENTSPEDSPEL